MTVYTIHAAATAAMLTGLLINRYAAAKHGHWADAICALTMWALTIRCIIRGETAWAYVLGTFAAGFTISWFRNRPRGKGRRAARALGAKSKALVQALVDRITPSPIPGGGAA